MKFFNFEFEMILSGITVIALLWTPVRRYRFNKKQRDRARDIIDSWRGGL